jgi:hypothetical protein
MRPSALYDAHRGIRGTQVYPGVPRGTSGYLGLPRGTPGQPRGNPRFPEIPRATPGYSGEPRGGTPRFTWVPRVPRVTSGHPRRFLGPQLGNMHRKHRLAKSLIILQYQRHPPPSFRNARGRNETLSGGWKNAMFRVHAGAPGPPQLHRARSAINFGGG